MVVLRKHRKIAVTPISLDMTSRTDLSSSGKRLCASRASSAYASDEKEMAKVFFLRISFFASLPLPCGKGVGGWASSS